MKFEYAWVAGADAGLLKGEGTTHIRANCACANLRPRPFSASLAMATNHARAENVLFHNKLVK